MIEISSRNLEGWSKAQPSNLKHLIFVFILLAEVPRKFWLRGGLIWKLSAPFFLNPQRTASIVSKGLVGH